MSRRQTMCRQWLIITSSGDSQALAKVKQLPLKSGVLLLEPLGRSEMRQLRFLARRRKLTIAGENGRAIRVHDLRELRNAMLRRVPLIFLSPLHATRTHPTWAPIGRMRAAALANIGRRELFALGGMNEKRFAKIAPLGFVGWAGITAWSAHSD